MLLLLPPALLLLTWLAILFISQVPRPARYAWLVALVGTFLSWGSLFVVYFFLPLMLEVPVWGTLSEALVFRGDEISWVYAVVLLSVTLAVLLSDLPNEVLRRPLIAFGVLILAWVGILASFSATPLTLVFLWAAIDLSEWGAQVRSTSSAQAVRSLTFGLTLRILGLLLLLWTGILSAAQGLPLRPGEVASQLAPYLALAVAFRLGVLPLHLPYPQESLLRRGFGTQLRVVSVASALVLLDYLPQITPPLLWWFAVPILITAILAAWNWLMAADALDGRVFWMIAGGGMAVLAAVLGDRNGSLAWGVMTLCAGSLLFLWALDHPFLRFLALIGWWTLSGLPYSLLSESAQEAYPWSLRLGVWAVQILLGLGYLVHWQRKRPLWKEQPAWMRNPHFVAMILLSALLVILGFWRSTSLWQGMLALLPAAVTWALFLLRRRLPFGRPPRAHWIRPPALTWMRLSEKVLGFFYRLLEIVLRGLNGLLEGASGLLWSLLVLMALINLLIYVYR
ncbi:MAG: hypothetical protein WHS87_01500 [Anaerolineales bacterium]